MTPEVESAPGLAPFELDDGDPDVGDLFVLSVVVPPLADLDADAVADLDADVLADLGADEDVEAGGVVLALADVWAGWGVVHGVVVLGALAVFLLDALAEAEVAVLAGLLAVLSLVFVLAGLLAAVLPGLGLVPTGLLAAVSLGLGLLAAGLLAWVTLGEAALVCLFEGDGETVGGGHEVGVALRSLMALLLWLRPLAEDAIGLADPAAFPPPVVLGGASAWEPSWRKASRSGGTARATPIANTAQAMARAGRSSPSRQSRCCRRGWPRSAP